MKRARGLLLVILLGLTFLPLPAAAATGIEIISDSATVAFPAGIEFRLHVRSDTVIQDIRLQYRVERREYINIVAETFLELVPGREQDVRWVWDMRQTGELPPGAVVEYWWLVITEGGEVNKTDPVALNVNDERYDWRRIEGGNIAINWYRGDEDFARQMLEAAGAALARLEDATGAVPRGIIEFYIYGSGQEVQGAMVFSSEWTGGVAYARYGIITLGIGPGDLAWGSRAIAHELSHLVVHEMTDNPYSGVPVWLNEGLSMMTEGPLEFTFSSLLSQAISNDSLDSVRTLASPFSAFTDQSLLAYAESYSIVNYLVATYGPDMMSRLLGAFSQGSTYDDALMGVYGLDMDTLDRAWRKYLGLGEIPGSRVGAASSVHEERGEPGRQVVAPFMLPV
ncbi:peptidase MA family metallohydrolase [Chloroflexota bacterium]